MQNTVHPYVSSHVSGTVWCVQRTLKMNYHGKAGCNSFDKSNAPRGAWPNHSHLPCLYLRAKAAIGIFKLFARQLAAKKTWAISIEGCSCREYFSHPALQDWPSGTSLHDKLDADILALLPSVFPKCQLRATEFPEMWLQAWRCGSAFPAMRCAVSLCYAWQRTCNFLSFIFSSLFSPTFRQISQSCSLP